MVRGGSDMNNYARFNHPYNLDVGWLMRASQNRKVNVWCEGLYDNPTPHGSVNSCPVTRARGNTQRAPRKLARLVEEGRGQPSKLSQIE